MNRYFSYLNSAVSICSAYNGQVPFAIYIKQHFSLNKKFGSKDRKQVSHLCYCFFRIGKALPQLTVEEKIVVGLFLCSSQSNEILATLKNEWNEKASFKLNEKISFLQLPFSLNAVFPLEKELSDGVSIQDYCNSFFIQPDLFIRIRPGNNEKVVAKLDELNIAYEFIPPCTIRLSNNFKVDQHFELDHEVVIQDYNSQQTGKLVLEVLQQFDKINMWDCCAGSGGKSIMSYDLKPTIQLTVTDVRKSILLNLEQRFLKAGINNKKSFIIDLTKNQHTNKEKFDFVLADVPCSGSGTWSRTPEHLCFFEKQEIDKYATLQKQIVANCVKQLKPGGHLLYITCSVFKKENEAIVNYIQESAQLQLIKSELLKGYNLKADTMFVALFSSSTI